MSGSLKSWLLRGALVLAAFFLGLALNTFQFRDPFRGFGPDKSGSSANRPAKAPDAEEHASAGPPQADALPAQAPTAQSKGGDQPASSAPAQADTAAANPATAGIAPSAPGAAGGSMEPEGPRAMSAPPGAPAPEQAGQSGTAGEGPSSNNPEDGDRGKPAEFAPGHLPGAPSLERPKMATSPDSVSAAGIGRRVPAGVDAGEPAKVGEQSSPRTPAQVPVQATGEATGGKIMDVATEDRPGEFVLTIITDGPVERVTTFAAKGPPRLAVDLWGNWKPSGQASRTIPDGLMDRIRIGAHQDRLRVVIDYRDKNTEKFLEPVVEKQARAVVVRVPKR